MAGKRSWNRLKRMVRNHKGRLYIMRVCITMLLCWHKIYTEFIDLSLFRISLFHVQRDRL
ncbi:hypothetical protein Syun_007634 [Stephania yunnanensis]|uniref:Uncharacterized protein n=1 Tax=Stephania yunnanensis TaxID=152371 RepID=A0AAP0KYV4_9MAGN